MICGHFIYSRAAVRLLNALLFVTLIISARAQEPKSSVGGGFGPAYDVAHETTLTGTIQDVVTKPAAGGMGGLHLLVNGPQGTVDAHLGAFLSKETKDSLHTGMLVQIVGAPIQLHDKEYFLARELNIDGHTVVIRSERGFLVLPRRGNAVKRTKEAKGELQ
jgi:hypothetical protein